MKRICVIFLALLLAGCAGREPSQETTEAIESTPPAPVGLYDPDSAIEQQTNGAVRAYPLRGDSFIGFAFIGEKVLVVDESGELTLLSGEHGVPVATMAANTEVLPAGLGFSTTKTGVAYYSEKSKQVFLLNPLLKQTGQVQLPDELQQTPVISLSQNEIYYCIGEEILALDITSGIERLVKQQTCQSQKLVGCYFDGTLLACEITDKDGQVQTQYISAETGQTMSRDQGIFYLDTYQEQFVALRMDITVLQQIVGSGDGECQSLYIPEDYGAFYSALPLNGVLTCLDTNAGQQLSFYDLTSGEKTAEVMLPGVQSPVAIQANEAHVWILAAERETGEQVLYRWDKEKSPVFEVGSYLRPLYTAQSPDVDGITLQQEHVDWYNQQYGVRIAIWENALQYAGDFEVIAEHQPAVITAMLTQLEELLPQFPTDFLRTTVEEGWIRIGLVRSIESGEDWTVFWEDGDCCILITSQADVPEAFLMGLAYGIDTHILGNSRAYDEWAEINPKGFVYGEGCDPKYLEGESRYFTDEFAAESILEDRSRLFAYGMLPGNAEIFAAEGIQNKLRCICEGIREAYELEKHAEAFPWEQYLEIPLYEVNDE